MNTYNVYHNKTDEKIEVALIDSDTDDTLIHLSDYHFTHKYLGTIEANNKQEAMEKFKATLEESA